MENMGDIMIYRAGNGHPEITVKLDNNTVWLSQKQIAVLFSTQRPAITKHLNNIFKEGELLEKAVCSILEHTAEDGKVYSTKYYNLDVITQIEHTLAIDTADSARKYL
jgi:hypothetical protein